MHHDPLATVCKADVHGATPDTGCPKWCDAGWRAHSQNGSPHRAPVVADGANSVPWTHILVTGETAMVGPPVPMFDRPRGFLDKALEFGRAQVADSIQEAMVAPRVIGHSDDVDLDLHLETQRAVDGVRALLRLMGQDPDRDGIRDTPARVVKAYVEMADAPGDPATLLAKQFPEGPDNGEMVTVNRIHFTSLCEHHLLPFTGTATVAYIPSGVMVVGLSKIPRVVQHYARQPQVQERLTGQITAALDEHLETNGSACRIESTHQCMSLRGVRAQGSAMVTTSLTGRFLADQATRAEFMAEAMR